MDVIFDYQDAGFCRFGKLYRPVAEISLYSTNYNKWLKVWMVVDTGADHSILPKYFSNSLGISLNKDCYKEWTTGIGGDQRIFMLKKPLRVKLGEMEHYVPVAMSENDNIPPIMGRLGFIDSFNVEFLIKRKVIFKT